MTQEKPLISIITVVYNGDKYLEQTIQSVLNQSYPNIEYIIIDGGSTDGTLEIINKYKNRIAYTVSEPDKGIYDAMNKGIGKATGQFVGIINSDDYYEPEAVQAIVDSMLEHPEVDLFFGNMYILNDYMPEKQLQTYKNGQKLHKSFSIWHPTVFIKRAAYEKFGLYDLAFPLAADYELILRLHKKGCKFHNTKANISNFREGGVSSYNPKVIGEQFRLQKKHTGFANASFNLLKNRTVQILQNLFKALLGQKKYHTLRYKYLYK